MQYMNDPSLIMMQRDHRGLNVNDINSKKNSKQGPGSLPPTGPIQRAISVRPHQLEYDIINPGTKENEKLRMSGYGKNVLGSQGGPRSQSNAAGTKQMPKNGEADMNQIWPADEGQRQGFNERTRNLDTEDINRNVYNPRMQKLKDADAAKRIA